MIAIIDSGGANIASVQFALERLGAKSFVSGMRCISALCGTKRHALPFIG